MVFLTMVVLYKLLLNVIITLLVAASKQSGILKKNECYIQVWDIKCKQVTYFLFPWYFETVFITRSKNYPIYINLIVI